MSSLEVRDMADAAEVAPLLEQDRIESAYGLCDLEPPYLKNSHVLLAADGPEVVAVVVVHQTRIFSSVHAFGRSDGVRQILAEAASLPAEIGYVFRQEDMAALRERYTVRDEIPMFRMVVRPERFRPSRAVDASIRRLTPDGLEMVHGLYSQLGTGFLPEMLADGMFFGAFVGGALVAIAGTHCYSASRSIGAVGGVYTQPSYRGQGLATAVTGAVVWSLINLGIRDTVLNVRADNHPAIAAYQRLGFTVYRPLVEGHASVQADSR